MKASIERANSKHPSFLDRSERLAVPSLMRPPVSLCSGPARRAGAGGPGREGGVQHAAGPLRAAPAPRGGDRSGNPPPGALRQGDLGPAEARAQGRHPRVPSMVSGIVGNVFYS